MIEKCITNETSFIEIHKENNIENSYNINDQKMFDAIAQNISNETGVPKKMIYQAPHCFYINHWYKINNEWFFYKNITNEFSFINELLGEKISEYFDLDTVHYNIAKLCPKKQYGLISKNFCNPNETYKTSLDYSFSTSENLDILEKVKKICKTDKEYEKLLNDLKKFFIRDFFTVQIDRNENNLLFKETKNGVILGPLYDYENSFKYINTGFYKNQIATLDINDNKTYKLLKKDIEFQKLLYKLIDISICSILEEMEDINKICISNDLKKHYLSYTYKVKKLICDKKLVK